MQELTEITGLILLSIFTRLPFFGCTSSDLYIHLWLIRFYEKSGTFSNKNLDDSLIPGYLSYPPIPHIFLAKLPERYQGIVGGISNIAYDLFVVLIIYFVGQQLFYDMGIYARSFGISAGAACALIWATSPILHPFGARLKSIGGRALGNLFVIIYFLSFYEASITGMWPYYIPCLIFGVLVILSSQFALQVLMFSSIGLSLAYLSFAPLMVLAAVFILGLSIPSLGIRKQLEGKWEHIKWYSQNLPSMYIYDINRFGAFIKALLQFFNKPKELITFILFKCTPSLVLILSPCAMLVTYWLLKEFSAPLLSDVQILNQDQIYWNSISKNNFLFYSFALAASGLTTTFFISFRQLAFLGEAERYMEYAAIWFTFLFLAYVLQHPNGPFVLFLATTLNLMVIFFSLSVSIVGEMTRKIFSFEKNPGLLGVINYLNDLAPKNIITLPTKLSCQLDCSLQGKHKFYFPLFCSDKSGFSHLNYDSSPYYVRSDLSWYAKQYSASIFVGHKSSIEEYKNRIGDFNTDAHEILFENEDFFVLHIKNQISKSE
jgi:hypothetical protein